MTNSEDRPKEGKGVELSRILNRDLFLHLLDLEVKRARRYQNFLCLLTLNLRQFSNNSDGWSPQTCYQTLGDLLRVEIRESDILGSVGENQMVVLLPYADQLAGGNAKTRFESVLKYFDFRSKGYEVIIEQISFPMQGTNTIDLLKKVFGPGVS